jgi:hypothetical protein
MLTRHVHAPDLESVLYVTAELVSGERLPWAGQRAAAGASVHDGSLRYDTGDWVPHTFDGACTHAAVNSHACRGCLPARAD